MEEQLEVASIRSNNRPKTPFPDDSEYHFEIAAGELSKCIQMTEMIQNVGLDGLTDILDIIVDFVTYNENPAVCFGDSIQIERAVGARHGFLKFGSITHFKIMRDHGDNSYEGRPLHFGEDFVLEAKEDFYIQRGRIQLDDRKSVHKTVRFAIEMVKIEDVDMEYKQTVQFDVKVGDKMGRIVRYGEDTNRTGLTFGGNFPVKKSEDHRNPNNDFRTWMTLRNIYGETVVSWWAGDEHLRVIKKN